MNPNEIGDAINYILNNPKEAKIMGQNGRKMVIEKYNWDIEKKKLMNLYKQLSS
jgi:glycosyltransferase involved in cell wall biosynthesis